MSRQGISTGSAPNDGTGDSLLVGANKINDNFNEVYTLLGDGNTLPSGIVTTLTAGNHISLSASTGGVTITGLANTDQIRSNTLLVTGVSTVGVITGSTGLGVVNVHASGRVYGNVTGDLTGDVTGDVTGNVTGNADTATSATSATLATNFTVSANNTTDETVYPVFVDGATGTQGAETDTGLNYNPSTGNLTATKFTGDGSALTGLATTESVVAEHLTITGVTTATNQIQVRSNDSTPGRIDYYCESSNAHYTRVQAAPHASYSGNATVVLPASSGTLLNEAGDGTQLTGIVTALVAGSNISLSNSGGTYTITGTGGGGGGAGGAGTLIIGYGSTTGDTPVVVGTATTINFVGTGYTVSVANSVATIRNLGMGFTSLNITSAGYATTINEGDQISYTATASDANAKFFIEDAPSGLGQIGINYDSGVMGGGQNASAGTYIVKLRAATLFGLSEPFPVSFTVDSFTLTMDNMFGAPNTFVMNTDDADDAVFTSLSSGGLVSHDGSNYVIDRSNTNYSTATNHALYYDNTNNVLYGFRTNSSNSSIQGIFKWTSVSDPSDGITVGSGSLVTWETWADTYAPTEVSALGGTKTYNTLTLDASSADFDGAYTRQSFKAKLDTGSASSGNALFAADDNYWWFLKDGDNSRMIIYDSVGGAWVYVYVSGANFSTAADNTAVGSPNSTESQSITNAIYDGAAFQPQSEYSEITYPGSVGVAAYQPGGNYTNFYGSAFAMKITTTGGLMNNFGTKASPNAGWAYGFTLEDPWVVTGAGNQMLTPESASDGWHNYGLSIFNISSTTYDYAAYGSNGYGPYSSGTGVNLSRVANTNNIANAGDTVQVRWDGTTYRLYINGSEVSATTTQSTYMSSSSTTNPVLTFGDTTAQEGGTISNDYGEGNPWPFRIRDLWIANNGNISASDVAGVGTFRDRNIANWSEYSDVDVYITMNSSGITTVKGSGVTVERKAITYS